MKLDDLVKNSPSTNSANMDGFAEWLYNIKKVAEEYCDSELLKLVNDAEMALGSEFRRKEYKAKILPRIKDLIKKANYKGVVPKVDQNWDCCDATIIDRIRKAKALEIQLLGPDLEEAYKKAFEMLNKLEGLENVILHMPNAYNIIELSACNQELKKKVEKMFFESDEYGKRHGIQFYVLFHIMDNYKHFVDFGGLPYLKEILAFPVQTRVLLENSIRDIRLNDNSKTTLEQIFQVVDDEKLFFCFDLCHHQASENAFERRFELTDEQKQRLKSVHFSYTANKDGYREKKKTHGVAHPNVALLTADLEYLKRLGVDVEKVWLVLEVNEDDYSDRASLRQEIMLFEQLK